MLYLLRRTPVKTLKHLPKFLPIDNDFKNTELISDDEHEKLRLNILDVKNQLFVETATWGLSDWERLLDLSVKENAGIEDRRIQILLKLQGANTVSETFMNNLINMFCQDKSGYIIQHNPEYWFEIVLNGNQKLDLDSLSDAIETYKPAHLGYMYSVNIKLNNLRYVGSKIGSLRSYYLKPKLIDNTDIMQKQYNMGKVSNIKYIDIGIAGIMSEVNTRSKKYMLANTGQLRETTISIGNFIKPLDFNVKITHAHSFSLYKTNCINPKSLEKANVKVKNMISAKTTNLREYRIKIKEDET